MSAFPPRGGVKLSFPQLLAKIPVDYSGQYMKEYMMCSGQRIKSEADRREAEQYTCDGVPSGRHPAYWGRCLVVHTQSCGAQGNGNKPHGW